MSAERDSAAAESGVGGKKPEADEERSTGGKRQKPAVIVKEHWPVILRVVELVLSVICIGLIVDPVNYGKFPNNNLHHVGIVYSAYSAFIVITGVIVLGRMLGEQLGWRMSVAFSLVGAILYIAAGAVIITDWSWYMYHHVYHPSKQYLDMMCSSGVFSIFTSAIFILDAVLTFKKEANI